MSTIGAVGTFNRTVGVKVDMDEAVALLSPHDAPITQWLPWESTNQTTVEWMNEELLSQKFEVVSSDGTGSGDLPPWTIVGDAGAADEFRVGDVLANDADPTSGIQYLVTTVTDDQTLVVAPFGETEDSDSSDMPVATDVLVLIGQYRNEGADPVAARSNEREAASNITQIVQEAVEVTRTEAHRSARNGLYGMGNRYDHEVMKRLRELNIRLERNFLYSRKAESSDKKKRTMAGLYEFIGSNNVSAAKATIVSKLNELIQKSYDVGGNSDSLTLFVSPALKSLISETDKSSRRTTRTETTAGYVVERYISDFGEVRIQANRHLGSKQGIMLDREYVSGVNFDPIFHELLGKTGDREHGHIVCEKTLKVRAPQAHATITVSDL